MAKIPTRKKAHLMVLVHSEEQGHVSTHLPYGVVYTNNVGTSGTASAEETGVVFQAPYSAGRCLWLIMRSAPYSYFPTIH